MAPDTVLAAGDYTLRVTSKDYAADFDVETTLPATEITEIAHDDLGGVDAFLVPGSWFLSRRLHRRPTLARLLGIDVLAPFLVGTAMWFIVSMYRYPSLNPLFWVPCLLVVVLMTLNTRRTAVWPVGFLTVVTPVVAIMADGFDVPTIEQDFYALPLLTGFVVLGGYLLGGIAAVVVRIRKRRLPVT